jgi:hypothetical protein
MPQASASATKGSSDMPLQFRRGHSDDLPPPSDAAVGEPLFTTDDGKLRIKKADGSYALINGTGDGSGSLDLSSIDAGSMVKVNTARDGFVAASGADVPQHNHAIANITALQDTLNNKSPLTHTHAATDITSGQIPSAVTFVTTEGSGFSNAVNARLIAELPDTAGVLDIAQQSTLVELGDDITAIDGRVTALENDLPTSVSYLTTFFTDAALPATPGSTGFLKYDTSTSAWSLVANTASAPTEINGGNASSFAE